MPTIVLKSFFLTSVYMRLQVLTHIYADLHLNSHHAVQLCLLRHTVCGRNSMTKAPPQIQMGDQYLNTSSPHRWAKKFLTPVSLKTILEIYLPNYIFTSGCLDVTFGGLRFLRILMRTCEPKDDGQQFFANLLSCPIYEH